MAKRTSKWMPYLKSAWKVLSNEVYLAQIFDMSNLCKELKYETLVRDTNKEHKKGTQIRNQNKALKEGTQN